MNFYVPGRGVLRGKPGKWPLPDVSHIQLQFDPDPRQHRVRLVHRYRCVRVKRMRPTLAYRKSQVRDRRFPFAAAMVHYRVQDILHPSPF